MERQLKSLEVMVRIEDLTDCMGEELLVTQVFANLFDNAKKYLDPARPGEIIFCRENNEWMVGLCR